MVKSGDTPHALTGTLTRHGRLTRGGVRFLRGFGMILFLGIALEWRSLTTAAFGHRLPGIVQSVDATPGQRAYQVRVAFAPGGRAAEFQRDFRPGRNSGRRLQQGDAVEVAYWPAAPERAVLLHRHENWAGVPWVSVLGAGLLWMSWYWAPRRTDGEGRRRATGVPRRAQKR